LEEEGGPVTLECSKRDRNPGGIREQTPGPLAYAKPTGLKKKEKAPWVLPKRRNLVTRELENPVMTTTNNGRKSRRSNKKAGSRKIPRGGVGGGIARPQGVKEGARWGS